MDVTDKGRLGHPCEKAGFQFLGMVPGIWSIFPEVSFGAVRPYGAGSGGLMSGGRGFLGGRHTRVILTACGLAMVCLHPPRSQAAEIVKIIDRKFPIGKYCPLESRSPGADLSFVAPATSVRITFSGNNFKSGAWNKLHLDNITVVLKSVFDDNLLSPAPGPGAYNFCYDTTPPPGQPTGGVANAPTYDYTVPGTPEILVDLFPTNVSGWTGAHLDWDGTSAPSDPPTGTDLSGGALRLGLETDGAVGVSASKIVSGLTVGQTYVVFGWWYIQNTDRLTIGIGIPCADPDGDGYVSCSGCDVASGQTCGDCNQGNAHCNASCTDADGDGWCVGNDCNDSASGCTNNCAVDLDADATPDCRDSCIDTDHDGYGSAGGGGNTCLGADCAASNPYCNVSCTDADADGRCLPGDCNDTNPGVGNDLPEVNDCADQQCPGNLGFGVIDEISGFSGFLNPANKNVFSWPAQAGANGYQAVRSTNRTFTGSCTSNTTPATNSAFSGNPAVGSAYYFLVRPIGGCKGSWGQRSSGVERTVICGMESACGNGVDDDADGSTDCADTDCMFTPQCRSYTFTFTDNIGDDIATTSLATFFQSSTVLSSDYLFFQIVEPGRTVAWCSQNALFYKTDYQSLASTNGTVSSGAWNKWRKTPLTGNAWQGPDTAAHVNTFGNDCFGDFSWCSEQFPTEPQNAIFPNRTNDCEAYDLATGACRNTTGGTWTLTIKIGATRLLACGF